MYSVKLGLLLMKSSSYSFCEKNEPSCDLGPEDQTYPGATIQVYGETNKSIDSLRSEGAVIVTWHPQNVVLTA